MIKKNIYLLVVFIACFSYAQKKDTKVLFVIVDGIPADVIEKVYTPNLDKIAREGGYTRAYVGGEKDKYSQTPTISAVGYNSLLTGTWANKHNVWGNSIKKPNYNYWTIFRMAKAYRPELKTAIFSTWLDNRTKLVGDGLSETGHIKLDYVFDGYEHDTINFPHDKKAMYIHKIDEHVVEKASDCIKENAPDLSWIYLEYTDDMGHRFGDSDQFHDAVKIADKQIGKVWKAINYRRKQFNESWEIFITTDHGRDKETGQGHGGQSERERLTWIVTNAKNLNGYFKTKEPGIVDIMPTMMRTLNIEPKKEQLWEIDGVPLTGKISLSNAKATNSESKLYITWDVIDSKGKVKIWVSTENDFNTGGTDAYKLLKKADIKKGQATIDVSKLPSNFYKIVLEANHNTINTWVVIK
ncbi:alkaline phosphatase family protein [Wocania ichthyoenteri]|uniref:alkaline phosphatase family protein n=1 Tax=Wocania ichthyoenteri TaxID=1230531 RepID=UPI00053EB7E4|nr:alkaline phosphatase family protein [Wocania ichthyoenteri]